jgi:hypothetical protein
MLRARTGRGLGEHALDRNRTIQSYVVRLVDFAHTSRADERLDYLRPKLRAGTQEHVVCDPIARNRPSVRRGVAREKSGSC